MVRIFTFKVGPGGRGVGFLQLGRHEGGFALGRLTDHQHDPPMAVLRQFLHQSPPVDDSGQHRRQTLGWIVSQHRGIQRLRGERLAIRRCGREDLRPSGGRAAPADRRSLATTIKHIRNDPVFKRLADIPEGGDKVWILE